ncbi:NADPH-dependent F420 reductase [Mycobacterium sp.]|uniref:NADPH-dependent F420 reductase n=1 Tax=Mycobacterium sp. TaxID=1785 RepID=UPI002BE6A8FD|nr:NAD(P)-binding domain-containing protein [Mycobacterium sp.]HME47371.1 NAD(P)-binding domain-containing protein [Mycobacterium sp.]
MNIAVIGAGSVGSTLGNAWQRRGHEITYGVPNPDDGKYGSLGAALRTNQQAAAGADVVVLCTPWQGTQAAVAACGDLAGKVLIDCTNPLTPDFAALEVGRTTSGADQVAGWAPGARYARGVRLVATDLDWSRGRGRQVHGTGEALLMAMAGRRAALDDLSGPGQFRLARQLRSGSAASRRSV